MEVICVADGCQITECLIPEECNRIGCQMTKNPDRSQRFEGFKKLFTLADGERLLGVTNWRGNIIISTDERILIYDPMTDKKQEVFLGVE